MKFSFGNRIHNSNNEYYDRCQINGILRILVFWVILKFAAWSWTSATQTSAIMSQQYSYTISSDTRTYDALSGPVSNDLYLLDSLFSTPNYTVIRRESTSGSQVWMTALNMPPTVKGLSVDPSEQNIYVWKYSTQLDIIRLSSSTGALVSAQNL